MIYGNDAEDETGAGPSGDTNGKDVDEDKDKYKDSAEHGLDGVSSDGCTDKDGNTSDVKEVQNKARY